MSFRGCSGVSGSFLKSWFWKQKTARVEKKRDDNTKCTTNESQPKSPRRLERYTNDGNFKEWIEAEFDSWRDNSLNAFSRQKIARHIHPSSLEKNMTILQSQINPAHNEKLFIWLCLSRVIEAREYVWQNRLGWQLDRLKRSFRLRTVFCLPLPLSR